MTFELSKEEEMLRDTVRRIAKEQVEKGASKRDEKGEFAWDALKIVKENGLFACDFQEQWGGSGMGTLAFALAVEELARVCATTSLMLLVQQLGSWPVMLAGSDSQKSLWLPRLASGEKLIASGITEPGAGSDVAAIGATAVRKGDKYIINGTKQFISHADAADYISLAVVTDPTRSPRKGGLSVILLETGIPGFSSSSSAFFT